MAAPLIDLDAADLPDLRPAWTAYVGDDNPRHVPATVRAKGRLVRHTVVLGPFGVQFWWQARASEDAKWLWIEQSG